MDRIFEVSMNCLNARQFRMLRQREMEGTSPIGVVCHPEAAAVGFNNGPADRQTHARPVFPRGIESLEDPVRIHFSETAASITDE